MVSESSGMRASSRSKMLQERPTNSPVIRSGHVAADAWPARSSPTLSPHLKGGTGLRKRPPVVYPAASPGSKSIGKLKRLSAPVFLSLSPLAGGGESKNLFDPRNRKSVARVTQKSQRA